MRNQFKQTARILAPAWTVLRGFGIAWVLVGTLAGCNEMALQDDSVTHDAVETWATPLRASPADAAKGAKTKGTEKEKEAKGSNYFFNPKAREIEKSLGM